MEVPTCNGQDTQVAIEPGRTPLVNAQVVQVDDDDG